MNIDIQVPSVGESITTGTLATWLKGNGEAVQEGEMIFELETDKSLMEIPSPASGVLEILVEEETEVTIGQTVGRLAAGEAQATVPVTEAAEDPAPAAPRHSCR